MDLDILKILSNRYKYYKYKDYIKDHVVNKETKILLDDYHLWFSEDETRADIVWSAFLTWMSVVRHASLRADKLTALITIINSLASHSVDPKLEESVVQSFIDRDYAARIADLSLKAAEGDAKADINDISGILDEYKTSSIKTPHKSSHFVTEDIDEILRATTGAGGLEWRLPCLNTAIGPLRGGNFVIIGKRPDSGGTTFLASECTYMAPQLDPDEVVIWVNNEESGKNVRLRVIQAALGMSSDDLRDDPHAALASYNAVVGKGKIRIIDNPSISVKQIQNVLENEKAGLIVFDQLWKVKGFEKEKNEVSRQAELFKQAREWAKQFAPVMAVHQADGSASGERWIEMNQLYGSKTAIQGEADAIITIGRSTEPGYEKSRFIYVPKNKMTGGPLSDPAERNGKFEVEIKPEVARFK